MDEDHFGRVRRAKRRQRSSKRRRRSSRRRKSRKSSNKRFAGLKQMLRPGAVRQSIVIPKLSDQFHGSASLNFNQLVEKTQPSQNFLQSKPNDKMKAITDWYTQIITSQPKAEEEEGVVVSDEKERLRRSVKYAWIIKEYFKYVLNQFAILNQITPTLYQCLKLDNKWSSFEYLYTETNKKSAQEDYKKLILIKIRALRSCIKDFRYHHRTDEDDLNEFGPTIQNITFLLRTMQAIVKESDSGQFRSVEDLCKHIVEKVSDINKATNANFVLPSSCGELLNETEMITTVAAVEENMKIDNNDPKLKYPLVPADRSERREYAWLVGNSTFIPRHRAMLWLAYANHIVGPNKIHVITYKRRKYVLLGECHRALGDIYGMRTTENVITVVNWLRCIFTLMPDMPFDFLTEHGNILNSTEVYTLNKMYEYFDVLNDDKTRYQTNILPNVRLHQWDVRAFDKGLTERLANGESPTLHYVVHGRSKQPRSHRDIKSSWDFDTVENLTGRIDWIPGTRVMGDVKFVKDDHDEYIKDFLDSKVRYAMRDLPREEQEYIREYTSFDGPWYNHLLGVANKTITTEKDGKTPFGQGAGTEWWLRLTDIYSIIRIIRKFPGNESGTVVVYGGHAHTDHYREFFDFLRYNDAPVSNEEEVIDYDCDKNIFTGDKTSTIFNLSPDIRRQIAELKAIMNSPSHTRLFKTLFNYGEKTWNKDDATDENAFSSRPTKNELELIKTIPNIEIKRELLIRWMYIRFKRYRQQYDEALGIAKQEFNEVFTSEELNDIFTNERIHPDYTMTWADIKRKFDSIAPKRTEEQEFEIRHDDLTNNVTYRFSDPVFGIYQYVSDENTVRVDGKPMKLEKNTYISVMSKVGESSYMCEHAGIKFELTRTFIDEHLQRVPTKFVRAARIAKDETYSHFPNKKLKTPNENIEIVGPNDLFWPYNKYGGKTRSHAEYDELILERLYEITDGIEWINTVLARRVNIEYPYDPDPDGIMYVAPDAHFKRAGYLPRSLEEFEETQRDKQWWETNGRSAGEYVSPHVFIRLDSRTTKWPEDNIVKITKEGWYKRYSPDSRGEYREDKTGKWVRVVRYTEDGRNYSRYQPLELDVLRSGEVLHSFSAKFGRSRRKRITPKMSD